MQDPGRASAHAAASPARGGCDLAPTMMLMMMIVDFGLVRRAEHLSVGHFQALESSHFLRRGARLVLAAVLAVVVA